MNDLHVVIRAFGDDEKLFLIYAGILHGDTLRQETWDKLKLLLNRSFKHESGLELGVSLTCIDAGYRPEQVYHFARWENRIIAVRGHPTHGKPIVTKPINVDVTWEGKTDEKGGQCWLVGSQGKNMFYNRLRSSVGEPKSYHFYKGVGDVYYQQITNERLVYRYNKQHRRIYEWVALGDNHYFDCETYILAGAYICDVNQLDWDDYRRRLQNGE